MLIGVLILLSFLAFVIVIIVLTIKGVNQYFKDNVSGHTVEVNTGYGHAQLIIDGKVVDEIRCWSYLYNAKLQGIIDGVLIVTNIVPGFCRYRITTFVNGNKVVALSNK